MRNSLKQQSGRDIFDSEVAKLSYKLVIGKSIEKIIAF